MLSVAVIPQSSKAPGSIPFKSLFEGISFGGACNRKGNCNSDRIPWAFNGREILSSNFQNANDNIGGITDCFVV